MLNKKNDVRYCGVDYTKIKEAYPNINWEALKSFHHYVIERYNIHKRKDVYKQPKPWTDDLILLRYKFTNVRREHDKQSRYLIDNIANNPNLTFIDKLVNILLFRFWNNWDTMKDLGGPWSLEFLSDPNSKEVMREKIKPLLEENPDRLWFSSAYNQGGTKMSWKFPKGNGYEMHSEKEASTSSEWEECIPLRGFHIIPFVVKNNIIDKILNCKDQKECFETIKKIPGYADFLAYQVFVDFTYIKEFPFSENEFVIAGPGCRNGLDRIFEKPEDLTYEELLFYFRNNLEELFKVIELSDIKEKYDPVSLFDDLPIEDRYINIMSLENLMCEFSKYYRTVLGTGKPKNTYKGV